MVLEQVSEMGTWLMMAIALGLDGFSVSLTIGLQQIRLKRVLLIGIIIGISHMVLPFLGIVIGIFFSFRLQHITALAGSFILVFIGAYIIFSSLRSRKQTSFNPQGLQVFTLALLVSIDSFPVGLSLGLSGIKSLFVIFLFGCTAVFFSWAGMLIGKKAHTLFGVYSEMLGGTILFLFGLKGIF